MIFGVASGACLIELLSQQGFEPGSWIGRGKGFSTCHCHFQLLHLSYGAEAGIAHPTIDVDWSYPANLVAKEIILWDEAVRYHDKGELEKSLNTFNEIADTSRILFNCGVIHAALGEHADAVRRCL